MGILEPIFASNLPSVELLLFLLLHSSWKHTRNVPASSTAPRQRQSLESPTPALYSRCTSAARYGGRGTAILAPSARPKPTMTGGTTSPTSCGNSDALSKVTSHTLHYIRYLSG